MAWGLKPKLRRVPLANRVIALAEEVYWEYPQEDWQTIKSSMSIRRPVQVVRIANCCNSRTSVATLPRNCRCNDPRIIPRLNGKRLVHRKGT
jgi:hypothetical protein